MTSTFLLRLKMSILRRPHRHVRRGKHRTHRVVHRKDRPGFDVLFPVLGEEKLGVFFDGVFGDCFFEEIGHLFHF